MLAAELAPAKEGRLDAHIRFVFLSAPQRRISCYGVPRQKHAAWHDYLTDHGGDEGRPEIEEEIDEAHLEWTRHQVHRVLDAEVSRLRGVVSRLVLLGQSQGSCCALDAALTYKQCLGGVFCSIGQLYSVTPPPAAGRQALRIVTFNGAGDRCIGASLALRSYASLIDQGFHNLRMHVQPLLDHCGSTAEEARLLAEALFAEWKMAEPLPAAGGRGGAKKRTPRRSPKVAAAVAYSGEKVANEVKAQAPRDAGP